MKKLLLLPMLFVTLLSLAQTKITIHKTGESNQIAVNTEPNETFGGTPFEVMTASSTICRGFLNCDLSSIPEGSFINWARLTLFCNLTWGGMLGNNSSKLRRITSPWDWHTLTWNTQPTTTKRGQVELPNSTAHDEDYRNINVTNLVQAMIDSPATSFGFALKLDTENGARNMVFYGTMDGIPIKNPKLVIEYTAPGIQRKLTSLSESLGGGETELTLYPNPCNRVFNCNIKSADADNMILRVIDMLGRTNYSQPVNSSNSQLRIELPENTAGTYFVVLQNDKGETIVSQQLQVN